MALLILLSILMGIAGGLFVNYLADVLPAYRRPGKPVCSSCYTVIPWMSYLQNQACQNCGFRHKLRYWLVLLIYPLIFTLFLLFPSRMGFLPGAILALYLGLVALIDLEHRVILNEVSLVGIFLGIWVGLSLHSWDVTLLGGAAGYLVMYVLYALGILFNRLIGKLRKIEVDEVALGFGDVNLSGILGLMLGWPGITLGLLFAILAGGFTSAIYILVSKLISKYKVFTAIPYAPFLILGAAILLFRPI